MTDDELIALIQTTAAEDLTEAEIVALRTRMACSAPLCEAVRDHLQLEQVLAGGLTPSRVSVDRVLEHAALTEGSPSGVRWWAWGLGILAACLMTGWWVAMATRGNAEDPLPLAHADLDRTATDPSTPDRPAPANPSGPAVSPAAASGTATAIKTPTPPARTIKPGGPPPKTPATTKPDVPVAAAEPWQAAIAAAPHAPAFQDVSLQSEENTESPEDLLKWLEPLEGNCQPYHNRNHFGVSFEGLARLRAPWPAQTALRLSPLLHHNLRIHVWNGQQGVTLEYYEFPVQTWAAYATTRSEQTPRPATLALVGVDNDRYRRLGKGTIELRHEADQLVLSRGDEPLLLVPLAGAPTDVYFEGKAVFREIRLMASAGLPVAERPANNALSNQTAEPPGSAAALPWKGTLSANAAAMKRADGSIKLSAPAQAQQVSWLLTEIPDAGLRELVFEVVDPRPGTGLVLASHDQQLQYQLGFFREGRTQQVSFGFLRPGDLRTDSDHDPHYAPVPWLGSRHWLRLVLGAGTLKCWTSADGIHWGRAIEPWRDSNIPCDHVGIYCLPGEPSREITLARLEARPLLGITSLSDPSITLPPLIAGAQTISSWLLQVMQNQPVGADATQWRQSCAVGTLAAGVPPALARPLLAGLLADGLQGDRSVNEKLQLLEDVLLLSDTWDHHQARRAAEYYQNLGDLLARNGEEQAYSLIRPALIHSEIWSTAPLDTMPHALVRDELLALVYQDHWGAVRQLSRKLLFFTRRSDPDERLPPEQEATLQLIQWAAALAYQADPNDHERAVSMPPAWRHPLVEQLAKENYNVLAEFQAAMQGQAYRDACQLITAAGTQPAAGLLPHDQDLRLLVSLPGAIALAMRETPELKQAMQDHFGGLAQVRARQAMQLHDAAGVRAVTEQFQGTQAASEAHRWLGDRALAMGDIARADGQYRAAWENATRTQRTQLAARQRLAAALNGNLVGTPVTESVQLADGELSAAEFEQLIKELLARPAAGPTGTLVAADSAVVPAITDFTAQPWSRFDGNMGRDPANVPYENVDWAGQQLSHLVVDDLLLVSNRFQISGYELATGTRRFTTALDGAIGRTHQWPFFPMRLAASGGNVHGCLLMETGPTLVCLDQATGKLEWRTEPGISPVSDPLLVQGTVYCITARHEPQGVAQLSLTTFDSATGEALTEHPLAQFRTAEGRTLACQAVVADDTILVAVEGSLFCCDLLGQIRWLRRQTLLPAAMDRRESLRHWSLPLVDGRLVYALQPGVRSLEAVDRDSGQLVWQCSIPDLDQLLGLSQETLLVRTQQGLVGLDAKNGRLRWSRHGQPLLTGNLVGGDGAVLICQRELLHTRQSRPGLIWLDPRTGQELARFPVDPWQHEKPVMGPLVHHQGRLLAFAGRDERDPTREIFLLTPSTATSAVAGQNASKDAVNKILAGWSEQVDPALHAAARVVIPGWSLLDSHADGQTGLQSQLLGESQVLVTLAAGDRPVRFARLIRPPANKTTRLRMRAGQPTPAAWKLTVRVGDTELLAETVQPESLTNGWRDFEVDLSAFAGLEVWLVIEQQEAAGGTCHASWKRLELVYSE